jgi:hydroxymethylpyrimidine pyrophosphatase-like HAD family hydrolase
MTKIKLLAIDLDGTLLSKTKHISHRNLKALRDYTNSGGTIVLASGRSIVSIKRIVNKIDRFTGIKSKYSIAFNGGYIDDISNDSVIENKIPNEVVKKI